MQRNQEIGKIQKDVPRLLSRALHRFIRDLAGTSADACVKLGKSGSSYKLTKEHVKKAVVSNPRFAFLKKVVEDIGLPEDQPQTFTKDDGGKILGKRRAGNEECGSRKVQRRDDSSEEDYVYTGGLSYMKSQPEEE